MSLRKQASPELKPDGSIVTRADTEIQEFFETELKPLVPGAAFWGEEGKFQTQTDNGLWVLDPVDGTSNFAFGQPIWGITLGFIHQNVIRFGIIYLPDLNMTLIGVKGQGATLNGTNLPAIPPGDILGHQLVSHGESTAKLQHVSPGKMRHIGAFCVEAAFVATQSVRALTTGNISLYDCAGGIAICRELGADVRMITGEPFDEAQVAKTGRSKPFYIGPANSNFPFGEYD